VFWFSALVYVIICGLRLISLLLLIRLDVSMWARGLGRQVLGLGLGSQVFINIIASVT